jgi:hypothetical protein
VARPGLRHVSETRGIVDGTPPSPAQCPLDNTLALHG